MKQWKADEILDRLVTVYANCYTYCDSGCVTTTFITATKTWKTDRPFKTAFIRPDCFRYEYQAIRSHVSFRDIVWMKGTQFKRVSHVHKDFLTSLFWRILIGLHKIIHSALESYSRWRGVSRLNHALGGLAGVSGGSSHSIPALLLPDQIGGWKLTEIANAQRMEDAVWEDVNCFRMQGMHAKSLFTLWIERNTFLVRRIEEQHQFKRFSTQTSTTYTSILNKTVDPKLLEFEA